MWGVKNYQLAAMPYVEVEQGSCDPLLNERQFGALFGRLCLVILRLDNTAPTRRTRRHHCLKTRLSKYSQCTLSQPHVDRVESVVRYDKALEAACSMRKTFQSEKASAKSLQVSKVLVLRG